MRVKVIGYRRQGVRQQYAGLEEPRPDQMAHYVQVLNREGAREVVQV